MNGLERMVVTPAGSYVEKVTSVPLLITRKIEDVSDGTQKLEVAFLSKGHWKKVVIPRGDAMDKGRLVKYANSGFPVHTGNASLLVAFLAAFEEANALPFVRSVDHLGWIDGTKEFYPWHMKDEVVFEGDSAEASKLVKAVTKAGDESVWMDMAVKLRTMPYARALLAAGFASVLVYPLGQRIIYLHLWMDSRSGKTAAQKAAVSIWGDPGSLLVSYNATSVGFERSAAAMNHLPLALDELQSCTLKPEHFSRLVYMLGNGIGRVRGDKFGGTQELSHWRNVILSSGEQPIITGNSMDGVVTRILDISGKPVTDPAFASEVHRIAENNYGFAGERFVEWLYGEYLCQGTQRLKDGYERLRGLIDMVYELYEARDAGFHLGNVSVIAYADYLSSIALFGADKEQAESEAINLAVMLLKNIHSQEKADSIDRAWDYICDWAKSNEMHFEVKKRLGNDYVRASISPIYGRYYPSEKKIRFIPSCFYEALRAGGFSVEKCYQGFKERGYVERTQTKARINGDGKKTITANIQLDLRTVDDDDDEKPPFS